MKCGSAVDVKTSTADPHFIANILSFIEEIIFISEGQVRCIQTITVQVEVPSLETC